MFKRKPKPHTITNISEIDQLAQTGTPLLIVFSQLGCAPCQVMDGLVNEIAREFPDRINVAKVDIGRVQGSAQQFGVMSTPTLMIYSNQMTAKQKRKAANSEQANQPADITRRWRTSGLVKKDQLARVVETHALPSV